MKKAKLIKPGFRYISGDNLTRKGDRPVYVGGLVGSPLGAHEVGHYAGRLGYYGVCRKK